jgi:hypothetical protein
MRKTILLAICLSGLGFAPAFGQANQNDAGQLPPRVRGRALSDTNTSGSAPALTKFNLDFPGGPPELLVKAIEKATGKPLNVIIQDDDRNANLPPLKMNNVDVEQLFMALSDGSSRTVYVTHGNQMSIDHSQYTFRTRDANLSDDSIWYLTVISPHFPPDPKVCRFYSLASYLDRGFTVDDITTAIHTAWNLEGASGNGTPEPIPQLFFHKETSLLIAVGDSEKLQVVQDALDALPATRVTSNEIDSMKQSIETLKQQVGQLMAAPRPTPAVPVH